MKNSIYKRLNISLFLPLGLLFFLFIFSQWQSIQDNFDDQPNSHSCVVEEKQKGAHVFGDVDSTDFDFLCRNNIEWFTLVAWSLQENCSSTHVGHHNGDSLMIQSSDSSWLNMLTTVRAAGFKVFVKPHVWINNPAEGKWRSDIFPTNEEHWDLWKASYRDFIIRYAHLAEKGKAEMFCVGMEFSRLAIEKPQYWSDLIREVRSIYSGKITYAANWYEEYEAITFWKDLDYIGIQAYFPLVRYEYPSVEQLSRGWNRYLPTLESIHKKYNRPILFTEMGYKSTSCSAITPWEWVDPPADKGKSFSAETQANCYEAFFNTVWKKDWMAGVHIWQLRSDFEERKWRINDLDFFPQGKLAEEVIAKGFSNE